MYWWWIHPGDTGTLSPVPGQCPHPVVVTAHTLTTAQLCTCCHTDNIPTHYQHQTTQLLVKNFFIVLFFLKHLHFTENFDCKFVCVVADNTCVMWRHVSWRWPVTRDYQDDQDHDQWCLDIYHPCSLINSSSQRRKIQVSQNDKIHCTALPLSTHYVLPIKFFDH